MRYLLLIAPLAVLAACGGTKTKPVVINTQSCNIEAPANQAEVAANSEISIHGWFYDKLSEKSNAEVRLQLASADRKTIHSVKLDALAARSDVSSAFNEPLAEKSGVVVKLPASTLPPGAYDISFIRETDEATIVCAKGQTVTLK